jgi:transposase
MSHTLDVSTSAPAVTIGLDLGDRTSQLYAIDAAGQRVDERMIPTTREALTGYFQPRARARVVLEVGTHSPWIARLLQALGHDAIVANPSAMYGARRRRKRNDRLDAEYLARQGRADVRLLHPIQHRGERAQQHLVVLRSRDQLVRARTQLINHVRGSVKSAGARLPTSSAEAFVSRVAEAIPSALQPILAPLLEMITTQTALIRQYDRTITTLITREYPDAQRVQQPQGVGPITALAFVLLIDDPRRFARSRDVAAYFGLVPRLDASSMQSPQLRITKAGDPLGRRLLVSAAQYILGPFGPDCDLRRFGAALMVRGGRNAKKRAVIAVARKLAVLLHHLWVHEAAYNPQHLLQSRPQAA